MRQAEPGPAGPRVLCVVGHCSEHGCTHEPSCASAVAAGLAVACRGLGLSTTSFHTDIGASVQQQQGTCPLAAATGQEVLCMNPWLAGSSAERLHTLLSQQAQGKDVVLIVSSSGVGLHGALRHLSQALTSCFTAGQLARALAVPCLLVIRAATDADLIARVQTELAPDPSIQLAGVVVQQTDPNHHPSLASLQAQLQAAGVQGARMVGSIPVLHNCPTDIVPAMMRRHLDIDALLSACTPMALHAAGKPGGLLGVLTAKAAAALAGPAPAPPPAPAGPPAVIAVAQDEAFGPCFPGDMQALHAAGAVVVPFSPLHDSHLPQHCQGVLLGGMRDLLPAHWHQLSANTSLRAHLQAFVEAGGVLLAQYAGLVYLSRAVVLDAHMGGQQLPLVGVLPFRAQLQPSSAPPIEACVSLTVSHAARHLLASGSSSRASQQPSLHAFLHSRVDLVEELRHSLSPWGLAPQADSPGHASMAGSSCQHGSYQSAFTAAAAASGSTDTGGSSSSVDGAGKGAASQQEPQLQQAVRGRTSQRQQHPQHMWPAGYCTRNVLASAMHWPFVSYPEVTAAWVGACRKVDAVAVQNVMECALGAVGTPQRAHSPMPASVEAALLQAGGVLVHGMPPALEGEAARGEQGVAQSPVKGHHAHGLTRMHPGKSSPPAQFHGLPQAACPAPAQHGLDAGAADQSAAADPSTAGKPPAPGRRTPPGLPKSRSSAEVSGASPPQAAMTAAAAACSPLHHSMPRFGSCQELSPQQSPPGAAGSRPEPLHRLSLPDRPQGQAWGYDMHLLQQQLQQQGSIPAGQGQRAWSAASLPLAPAGRQGSSGSSDQGPSLGAPIAAAPQQQHAGKPPCILEGEEGAASSAASSYKSSSLSAGAEATTYATSQQQGGQATSSCGKYSLDLTVQASTLHAHDAHAWPPASAMLLLPMPSRHSCDHHDAACGHPRLAQSTGRLLPSAPSGFTHHHSRSGSYASLHGAASMPDATATLLPPPHLPSQPLSKSSSMFGLSMAGDGYWGPGATAARTDGIVSLCPGATEVVVALGLAGRLVGVTDACDWPPQLRGTTPVACRHKLPVLLPGSQQQQQQHVLHSGGAAGAHSSPARLSLGMQRGDTPAPEAQTLLVDEDLLREERPALVVVPDVDRLSAADRAALHRALARTVLHPGIAPHDRASVVTMAGATLAGMLDALLQIGEAAGSPQAAASLVDRLRRRLRAAARAAVSVTGHTVASASPRVLVVSQLQPSGLMMRVGGPVPELLSLAGATQATLPPGHSSHSTPAASGPQAEPLQLALEPGAFDTALCWEQVVQLAPEVLVVAGAPAAGTLQQLAQLAEQPGWWSLPAVRAGLVFVVHAPLLLRPGPRLVEGVEVLAGIVAEYAKMTSTSGIARTQAVLPLQPILPAPGTWRTYTTAQAAVPSGRVASPEKLLHAAAAADAAPEVLKLSLCGGQRCRPSLLPNYLVPWHGSVGSGGPAGAAPL